jgi:hypothetical protein
MCAHIEISLSRSREETWNPSVVVDSRSTSLFVSLAQANQIPLSGIKVYRHFHPAEKTRFRKFLGAIVSLPGSRNFFHEIDGDGRNQ